MRWLMVCGQTVGKGVTPNGADLVTLTEYDG
jgi:hypothetical protein